MEALVRSPLEDEPPHYRRCVKCCVYWRLIMVWYFAVLVMPIVAVSFAGLLMFLGSLHGILGAVVSFLVLILLYMFMIHNIICKDFMPAFNKDINLEMKRIYCCRRRPNPEDTQTPETIHPLAILCAYLRFGMFGYIILVLPVVLFGMAIGVGLLWETLPLVPKIVCFILWYILGVSLVAENVCKNTCPLTHKDITNNADYVRCCCFRGKRTQPIVETVPLTPSPV